MGASTNEVEEVLKNAEANLRIAGFEDEEKRLKQKVSHGPRVLKLPQGPYIFCEFRTLEIPGLKVLFYNMIIDYFDFELKLTITQLFYLQY
jgi:hypothetical protein